MSKGVLQNPVDEKNDEVILHCQRGPGDTKRKRGSVNLREVEEMFHISSPLRGSNRTSQKQKEEPKTWQISYRKQP